MIILCTGGTKIKMNENEIRNWINIYTGEICTVSNNHNKNLYDTIFTKLNGRNQVSVKHNLSAQAFFQMP